MRAGSKLRDLGRIGHGQLFPVEPNLAAVVGVVGDLNVGAAQTGQQDRVRLACVQLDSLYLAVEVYPTRLALVTGGEPMLQKEVHHLFRSLLEHGYTVCVETGGHVPLDKVDPRVHKIMDLKCPSSGMMEHNHYENIQSLTRNDEVKFVIGDRPDFDWACKKTIEFDLCSRVGTVLFSPVYGRLPYDLLARWVLDSGLPVRMQLQLHRVIWPNVDRGV